MKYGVEGGGKTPIPPCDPAQGVLRMNLATARFRDWRSQRCGGQNGRKTSDYPGSLMIVFNGLRHFLIFGPLAIRICSPFEWADRLAGLSAGKRRVENRTSDFVVGWTQRATLLRGARAAGSGSGCGAPGVGGGCVAGMGTAACWISRSRWAAWTRSAQVRTSRLGFCRVVRAKRSSRKFRNHRFIFFFAPGTR
jgi:hypothetical protein